MSRSGTASQELSPLTLVMPLPALASGILSLVSAYSGMTLLALFLLSTCRSPVPPSNAVSYQAIQEVLRDCSLLIAREWEGLDLRVIRIQSQTLLDLGSQKSSCPFIKDPGASTCPRAVLLTKAYTATAHGQLSCGYK